MKGVSPKLSVLLLVSAFFLCCISGFVGFYLGEKLQYEFEGIREAKITSFSIDYEKKFYTIDVSVWNSKYFSNLEYHGTYESVEILVYMTHKHSSKTWINAKVTYDGSFFNPRQVKIVALK